jgi:CRP/FNR family transcriptional regulator, cyclic AMP receptor protein
MAEPATTTLLPASVEPLGDATGFVDRIYEMLDNIELFEDFERAEIRLLAHFMEVYRVPSGTEIIHEGDDGDYMLLIIDGEVDVFKNDREGLRKRIAVVGAGKTLGEMSMIDGAPRFSTCIAATQVTFSILTRDKLTRIIAEQPMLGAKILMELVVMLSQRLRQTSEKLVNLLEQ